MIKKRLVTEPTADNSILGKWSATVFYVDRKKCWLFTNGRTKYNLILTDVTASDIHRIEEIFKNTLFEQLVYDGIVVDFRDLNSIIGELDFLPTDNDRSLTAFQNHRLHELDWWKYEFEGLENMPMRDLTNRMNTDPVQIGKGKKMADYSDSIREMRKVLNQVAGDTR